MNKDESKQSSSDKSFGIKGKDDDTEEEAEAGAGTTANQDKSLADNIENAKRLDIVEGDTTGEDNRGLASIFKHAMDQRDDDKSAIDKADEKDVKEQVLPDNWDMEEQENIRPISEEETMAAFAEVNGLDGAHGLRVLKTVAKPLKENLLRHMLKARSKFEETMTAFAEVNGMDGAHDPRVLKIVARPPKENLVCHMLKARSEFEELTDRWFMVEEEQSKMQVFNHIIIKSGGWDMCCGMCEHCR